MNVSRQTVAILLSEEARSVLEFAGVEVSDPLSRMFYVQDTDDMGLWVRVERGDGSHLVFIRWEYVISMDVPAGPVKAVGFEA